MQPAKNTQPHQENFLRKTSPSCRLLLGTYVWVWLLEIPSGVPLEHPDTSITAAFQVILSTFCSHHAHYKLLPPFLIKDIFYMEPRLYETLAVVEDGKCSFSFPVSITQGGNLLGQLGNWMFVSRIRKDI